MFFNSNWLNFKLVKYNICNFVFKDISKMRFFLSILENSVLKKSKYKKKGFYDISKKFKIKLGKRSEYLR